MKTRLIAVLVALAAVLASAPPAFAETTLFTLRDPRLTEASGIARGITSPGVYYVQNDSGDTARFFALDARTGRVRAVYSVPGAQNHDWEDIAVAPDARGVASVWLADIGDNTGMRDEVQLYRLDEPRVDMTRYDVSARAAAPDVWRLRYPSGPVNAESLAVSPQGRAYVVTKVADGHSTVYAVPAQPAAGRVQPMTRIGAITFTARASLIPADAQLLATGAALSTDGSVLVVRTYTDAYLWRVDDGDIAAAVRAAPHRLPLPLQPQGEGVCIVGAALVVDSEHLGSAVDRVPLPAALRPTPSPTRTAPGATVSARDDHTVPLVLGAVAALVAIAALGDIALAVRRRRPRG